MKFSKLDKAKVQLLSDSPFFATLLLGTQLVVNEDIPTAATDGVKMYYNPEFIDSLDVPVVKFVLAHELCHMMMEHTLRVGSRNKKLYNIAADYAVNILLKEDNFTVWSSALLDEKYKGMSAEQIYVELMKNAKDDPNGGGHPEDGMGGDLMDPGNEQQRTEAASAMRRKVAVAATAARMAGKLSAGLAGLIDEVLNPKVPWQDLLRDYMTRQNKDDESWSRRNRRFGQVYLPARYSERMGEIVIIGDTSGSISQAELNQIAAEVNNIADAVKPECIRIVWADTKVAGEQTFDVGEKIEFKPAGGGGTDMRVPLEYVTKYDPEIVILATDGYTPWPDVEPEYPLIVVCSTNTDVPIGNVVRLN